MKINQFFVTLLICVTTLSIHSQVIKDYAKITKKQPLFYFGLGTGINFNCGILGIKLTGRPSQNLLIDVSAGFGSWGNKIGIGVIFNAKDENAWCPVIGVSTALGANNTKRDITVQDAYGFKTKGVFELNFEPSAQVNLGVQKQWLRPQGNRIVLELGISVLALGGDFRLSNANGLKISDDSKTLISVLRPGGLTVGFAYYFALN